MKGLSASLLLVATLVVTGCSSMQSMETASRGNTSSSASDWSGYDESGQATFYADKYVGRKTASGEVYQHGLKTAAHKRLPFGSRVKVTNTQNNKSVVVKVNDRGSFGGGRIIDLSKSAFSSIANPAVGVIPVEIEVLE